MGAWENPLREHFRILVWQDDTARVWRKPKNEFTIQHVYGLGERIRMPQGELSDAEAAAEVVRQYIEAMVAQNCEKEATLFNGTTAEELRKRIEDTKHVRFVWTGQPIPAPEFGPHVFLVPFTYEIETADGKRELGSV